SRSRFSESSASLPKSHLPPHPTLAATKRALPRRLMERGWTGDGTAAFDTGELDRAVFQRVFGYLAAPGVKVPRFSIEVKRRATTDPRLAWEVNIRTGRESGYGGSGPTRGIAVCRAALFLAANRARKWERPE